MTIFFNTQKSRTKTGLGIENFPLRSKRWCNVRDDRNAVPLRFFSVISIPTVKMAWCGFGRHHYRFVAAAIPVPDLFLNLVYYSSIYPINIDSSVKTSSNITILQASVHVHWCWSTQSLRRLGFWSWSSKTLRKESGCCIFIRESTSNNVIYAVHFVIVSYIKFSRIKPKFQLYDNYS